MTASRWRFHPPPEGRGFSRQLGNGRAQRILFEHLIINAGFQIDWWGVGIDQWTQANINSVVCDYRAMQAVFEQCVGDAIE
ncbi:hypothetical protein [Pseudomonas sp. 21LCFQ02]|uniref:hypothetical protein n=1 Tax=Pseudomonas sp. 21LCFQ02 TaxID=2957505 RepID=UPI00342F09D0